MARCCTTLEQGQLIRIIKYHGVGDRPSLFKNKIAMYIGEYNKELTSWLELLIEEKVEQLCYNLLEYEIVE